ncbi:hypothetical protein X801_04283, partial [Opisthorchis viverrini]
MEDEDITGEMQATQMISGTGNLAPEGGGSTSPDFVPHGSSSEQKTSSTGPLAHTIRRKSGDDKSPLNMDSELKPTSHPDSTSDHVQPTSDKAAQITDTTYVQVFDYEWHDYERVADLFEASRCLNPVDRPSLVRLLALARHNCPLIDGELQFPGPLNVRSSHFDAFELHEKLTALRLHQQARDRLLRECGAQESPVLPDSTQIQSLCASDPDAKQPSPLPPERARFNLPADGRSMEELIAYDCRWRSRQPCRCFVPMGGHLLPPCVEFPWLCPPASAVSSNGSSVSAVSGNPVAADLIKHSAPLADLPPTPDTTVSTSSTENRPKLSDTRSES